MSITSCIPLLVDEMPWTIPNRALLWPEPPDSSWSLSARLHGPQERGVIFCPLAPDVWDNVETYAVWAYAVVDFKAFAFLIQLYSQNTTTPAALIPNKMSATMEVDMNELCETFNKRTP